MSRKHSTRQTREGQHASSPSSHRQPTRESTATVAHPLQQLQQTHGNQAIQRLTTQRVQPKLEVGPPNDRYEREAERVARQITSPHPPGQRPSATAASDRVQRMCTRCQKRHAAGKPLDCPDCEQELQRSEATVATPSIDTETATRIQKSRRGGQPLSDTERSYFEPRFGREFGDVRVHTDSQADVAARAVNADAFTLGRDIVFRSGSYRPHTAEGRHLLAHELTHVIQQDRGETTTTVRRSTTRGAGGCGPPREIDEDRSGAKNAGAVAHAQIQSFLFGKGVLPELEIPRATKRNMEDTTCQPESRNNGFADLWRRGTVAEIAEIKPIGSADRLGVPEAEHYILRAEQSVDRITSTGACGTQTAGADDNEFASTIGMAGPVRTRTRFGKMTGVLPTDTIIGPFDGDPDRTLKAKSISPGAVGYWCTGGASETLPCDASSETITRYIDHVLSTAEHAVDEFVERRFVEPLDRALDDFDIRQLLTIGNNYIGGRMRSLIAEQLGVPLSMIPELNQATIDRIAQILESQMNSTVRGMVRVMLRRIKNRIVGELKRQLRQRLRGLLRQAILAICVGAPVVTLAHLLEKLNEMLETEARRLMPVVIQTVMVTIAVEIVQVIARALSDAMRTIGNWLLRALAVIGILLVAVGVLIMVVVTAVAIADMVPGDEVVAGGVTLALASLIPLLIHFVRTGEMPEPDRGT